jgi:hypothetical protein
MPGALWCQEQGGALHGKVFLDLNNNGVYEPEFGEKGFPHRVQMALIDCSPEERKTCDMEACHDEDLNAYNPNRCGRSMFTSLAQDVVSHRQETREFPRCPDKENGGCFQFQCTNCYGEYKIAAFLPPDDTWRVSSVTIGEHRPGWHLSTDPVYDGDVYNNFQELDGYTIAESECFRMFDDMFDLVPFVNLVDLGLTLKPGASLPEFVDSALVCSAHEDCPTGFECGKNFVCADVLMVDDENYDGSEDLET